MGSSPSDLRSYLNKVKGLGAAHHGTNHWWLQRVTAVAMIPLSLWFTYSLVMVMLTPNVISVAEWFSSPLNTIVMSVLLIATFIHARLGMQVIIEDYVKSPYAKYALILGNTFICFLFAALSILAVLKLHFLDVATSM